GSSPMTSSPSTGASVTSPIGLRTYPVGMTGPDWSLTGDTVERLRAELAEVDDETRADFDAFARFVAEQLAEYRIDPSSDPWATYHGLAFMSLVVDLARNNYEN